MLRRLLDWAFPRKYLVGSLCVHRSAKQLYMWESPQVFQTAVYNLVDGQDIPEFLCIEDDSFLWDQAVPNNYNSPIPDGWMHDIAQRRAAPPNPESKYVAAIQESTDDLNEPQRGYWQSIGGWCDPCVIKPPRRLKKAVDRRLGPVYVF